MLGRESVERRSALVAGRLVCPLCGAEAALAFTVTDRNRAITDRRFDYLRCRDCASYFLADVPSDLGRYYPPEYYALPSPAELNHLAAGESHKLKLLEQAGAVGGRLVEIGSGFGVFARAANTAGFAVTAIEMDGRCCEYLESIVGVRAIHSATPAETLATLPPSRVIALWHVIEHLPNPWQVLEAIASNLAPGGVLAVATPNPEAIQFRLLRERWAHVDAPRHLFLIPVGSLTAKAAMHGLRRVHLTTHDPDGRGWNRFGWEYALRRFPAQRPATRTTRVAAKLLELTLRPLESRGLSGAAYTAVFVKDSADQ
jgi:2-polyprenyl-3-methyl-5-hydroxy-6-metoxy-1,4-benzoquinol methylase